MTLASRSTRILFCIAAGVALLSGPTEAAGTSSGGAALAPPLAITPASTPAPVPSSGGASPMPPLGAASRPATVTNTPAPTRGDLAPLPLISIPPRAWTSGGAAMAPPSAAAPSPTQLGSGTTATGRLEPTPPPRLGAPPVALAPPIAPSGANFCRQVDRAWAASAMRAARGNASFSSAPPSCLMPTGGASVA